MFEFFFNPRFDRFDVYVGIPCLIALAIWAYNRFIAR
jgi:hypothetical protein